MLKDAQKPYARLLIQKLKECGIKEVVVTFDGSGDSGQIEEVSYGFAVDKPDAFVEWVQISSSWENGNWVEKTQVKKIDIDSALENFCYEALEDAGIDWYNNAGGYGELRINLDPIEINLEVSTRYTETFTSSLGFDENLEEVG
jgi:hypothetical protein